MSRTCAFVEALNQVSQQFGRGFGTVTGDAECSDRTILDALNIAAYFAALDAGCSQGQCIVTYSAWRCDKEAEAAIAESPPTALVGSWFKNVPQKQGKQDTYEVFNSQEDACHSRSPWLASGPCTVIDSSCCDDGTYVEKVELGIMTDEKGPVSIVKYRRCTNLNLDSREDDLRSMNA